MFAFLLSLVLLSQPPDVATVRPSEIEAVRSYEGCAWCIIHVRGGQWVVAATRERVWADFRAKVGRDEPMVYPIFNGNRDPMEK